METSSEKQEKWNELIAEWRASGQTQKTFCAERNLVYATFCYWRRKEDDQALWSDAEPLTCVQVGGGRASSLEGDDCLIDASGLVLRAGDTSLAISGRISIRVLARLAAFCQELSIAAEARDVSA